MIHRCCIASLLIACITIAAPAPFTDVTAPDVILQDLSIINELILSYRARKIATRWTDVFEDAADGYILQLQAGFWKDMQDYDGTMEVKARELKIAVLDTDTTGKFTRVQILASDAYDPPGSSGSPAATGYALVPIPSGPHPGIPAYQPGVGIVWVYAPTARQPLQRGSGGTLQFDWLRGVNI